MAAHDSSVRKPRKPPSFTHSSKRISAKSASPPCAPSASQPDWRRKWSACATQPEPRARVEARREPGRAREAQHKERLRRLDRVRERHVHEEQRDAVADRRADDRRAEHAAEPRVRGVQLGRGRAAAKHFDDKGRRGLLRRR